MIEDDDNLISRWSRRKRASLAEAEAEATSPPPEAEKTEEPSPDLTDEEWLEEHNLPEPENLGEGDDFSDFLKDNVPKLLRQRALRQLWRSNPVLANVDGLVDYGGDFTDAATVPTVLETAYTVGRGMVSKILDEPAESEAHEPENSPSEPADSDENSVRIVEVSGAEVVKPASDENNTHVVASADTQEPVDATEEQVFTPRRMTFKSD